MELSIFEIECVMCLICYYSDDKELLFWIVDLDLNIEFGLGCIGEIWIYGKNVFIGYYNVDDVFN